MDEKNMTTDPRVEKLFTKVELLEKELQFMTKRMDEQANTLAQISELARSIDRMTITQQSVVEQLQNHEKRIETIEQKPAKRWDSIVDKIIMVVLGAALAYALAKLGL